MNATASRRRIFVTLAAGALALATCASADDTTPAAPLPAQVEEAALAKLERAFWACDYVATTEGVQATPMAACRHVTEELKQQKFAGSFQQLLEWWRANKAAEHRRMAHSLRQ